MSEVPKTCTVQKRSRPDVAQRRQERKLLEEMVVKASLRKYLIDPEGVLCANIRARVEAYSKRMRSATLSFQYLLQQAFHGKEDVLSVELPDFTDLNFFRQLILGTKGCKKVHECIQRLHEVCPRLLADTPRFPGDTNSYTYGAKMLQVNFKNHLTVHLATRIQKLLKQMKEVHMWSDEGYVTALYDIHGWPRTVHFVPNLQEANITDIVSTHRKLLGLTPEEKITDAWLKKDSNMEGLLRHLVYMLREREAYDRKLDPEKPPKKLAFVPLRHLRHQFMTIDTSVLAGILVDCGYAATQKAVISMREEQWASILNYKPLQGAKCTFSDMIETDGFSLCVHFTRPKPAEREPCEEKSNVTWEELEGKRVLACDPGRSNIFAMVENVGSETDSKFKLYRLTRGQYYAESGLTRQNKKKIGWEQDPELQAANQELSLTTHKGLCLEDFQAYLEVYWRHEETLWKHYLKSHWAQWRFRVYGGKKRAIDKFLNQVENDGTQRDVVVAYGSAKFAPCGKGELAVPTTGAYRACSLRFQTHLVSEYATTKICYGCQCALCPVRTSAVRENRKSQNVRGLRWCESTMCRKFLDRDLNAAVNIYSCFQAACQRQERPYALRFTQPKIVVPAPRMIAR